jgi:peptide deformylase
MAVLNVITIENPNLRRKATRVPKVDDAIRTLMDDMLDTMRAHHGLGLAATQVDVHLRVIVMDVGDAVHQVANPEMVRADGEQTGFEGCLSVPGYIGEVARAERVVAKGLDRHGRAVRIKGNDLLARCIQHEIDHLDGVLFTDKLVPGTTLMELSAEELEKSADVYA